MIELLVAQPCRVWVYSDSLRQLLTLREAVRREVPGIVDVELHGEVSAQDKATLMADLRAELERRNVSVVFATSTASIGVSVVGYFDVVCAFFSGRMPANEGLQALYRERTPRSQLAFVAWSRRAASVRELPLPLRTVGDVVRAYAASTRRRCATSNGVVLSMLDDVQAETRRLSIEFARPLTLQLLRDDGFQVEECAPPTTEAAVRRASTPADAMRAMAKSVEAAVANNVARQSFRFNDAAAASSRIVAATIVAYRDNLDALQALVQVVFDAAAAADNDRVRFARTVHNLARIVRPEQALGLFGGEHGLKWSGGRIRSDKSAWLTNPLQTAKLQTTGEFLAWVRGSDCEQLVRTLYGRDAVRSLGSAEPASLLRSLANRLFGDACLRAARKNQGTTIAWPECARALDLLARSSRQLPPAFVDWRRQNAHAACSWTAALRAEAEFNAQRQPTDGNDGLERCIDLLKASKSFLPYSVITALQQHERAAGGSASASARSKRSAGGPAGSAD